MVIFFAVLFLSIYLNSPGFKKFHSNLGANYSMIGDYYLKQKDYPKALELFKKSVKIEPQKAENHHMLALGYKMNNQHEEAVKEYKIALKINRNLYQAHRNLGLTYEEMGQWNKAIEEYKKALKINPDQQDVKKRIKYIEQKFLRSQIPTGTTVTDNLQK